MRNHLFKTIAWIVVALFSGFGVRAQLTIDDNLTAQQLVDILVGTGITTSNAVLNCPGVANGKFTGVSNLGLDSGIILSTGPVKSNGSIIGINSPAAQFMSTNAGFYVDPDLLALSTNPALFDGCYLEFDFVPTGDTVKFNYVFGSEEYPGFVCSNVNDIFALLISGPGIVSNTPIPTKRNVALVPGTNTPIMINTINGGNNINSNCTDIDPNAPYTQYYVNNSGGQTVVFGGFTTVMTAVAVVNPCDTYKLKFAISNVGDGIYESGIFLKAGSLSSIGLSAGAQGMNINASDTAFIVRGCPAAEVTISREAASPLPLVVPYTLGGDAVNGVDYQSLSGNVTIPANSTTGTIYVKALPVPITGANKIAKIYFMSPYSCSSNANILDSAIVSIQDSILLSANVGDTGICLGQQLNIDFVTDTIYGTLDYEWTPATNVTSNSIDYASIEFPLPGQYFYQYKVRIPSQDTNCRVSTASFNVEVQDIKVNLGSDSSICAYDQLQMFAEVFPQDTGGIYQYNWSPADIFNDPTLVAPLIRANSYSTNVMVTVRTDLGCIGRDTMVLTVNPSEFINVLPSDTAICPGAIVSPRVTSSLPNTPLQSNYIYEWSPIRSYENATAINQHFSPEDNTVYRLLVKNEFGCIDTSFVDVTVHPNAVVNLPDSVVMWLGESYTMAPYTNATYFNWFPVSGISNPNISNPVFSPEVNTRYFFTGTTDEGCKVSDSIDVIVRQEGVVNMPNAFNPNSTTFKPVIRGNFSLEAFEIYDRWGSVVYASKDVNQGWDGTSKGAASSLGVYVYVIKLINNQNGSKVQKTGNVTLIR